MESLIKHWIKLHVVAEWSRALNPSSGVSDQQGLGLSLGLDNFVLKSKHLIKTFIVLSFLETLLINQHYVDKHQTMTLPLTL